MSKKEPIRLKGKTLAPGFGKGTTFVYYDILARVDEFYDIESSQIEAELQRFNAALDQIRSELDDLADHVKKEMDSDLADIFRAHSAIVQDPSIRDEVEQEIRAQQVSAGSAVRAVFRRWETRFRSMEAEFARQKGDDLRDLMRRLISSLAGIHSHELENLPLGSVLVASHLLPSDTIVLARRNAAAAILEEGGVGSHAALFAHEIGLPCITGITGVVEKVPAGETVLVDANAAEVIVSPRPEDEAYFEARREKQDQATQEALRYARDPAITQRGTAIKVFANVGCMEDTTNAIENGADGIGLYRIETAYLGHRKTPTGEELLTEIRQTLDPAKELPVYVRLLDAGADKPLPFMKSLKESNPALGVRGVRFLKEYPDLLNSQLNALLELSSEFDLHIVVPMVTLPEDMQWVKEMLDEAASRTGTIHVPKLGAMIEMPAAALAARNIAECADFLSIGTNDLTQYTFAADRENAAVDCYFDDTNEVIFRMLKMVREDVPDIPLSLCGELASRPGYVDRILECGIATLSVAPPSIPYVKQEIRQVESV